MSIKAKRSGVRFHLGALQKSTDFENQMMKNTSSLREQGGTGRDSGAPSPDTPCSLQPAAIRLLHNQTRMEILSSINDVLHSRAEHENSRATLVRLHDDLSARLLASTRASRARKQARLDGARQHVRELSAERRALEAQAARLREHLAQHEREHAEHAGGEEGDTIPLVLGKTSDKKPSRKADQKMAAGRLLREVLQLRSRLAALERRIQVEARRKKQAEEELAILRAAVARNRGKKIDRVVLKPLVVNY